MASAVRRSMKGVDVGGDGLVVPVVCQCVSAVCQSTKGVDVGFGGTVPAVSVVSVYSIKGVDVGRWFCGRWFRGTNCVLINQMCRYGDDTHCFAGEGWGVVDA